LVKPLHYALTLLVLASCVPEEPPPAPPAAPPSGPPVPELPALADVSFRDWAEIDPEPFLEIPLPTGSERLAWRFDPGRRFGYDYGETLTQQVKRTLGEAVEEHLSKEKNRGTFEFVAGKDRTALCRVKIQTSELSVDGKPVPRPPPEANPESSSDATVAEDGTPDLKKSGGRADARFYLLTLLALRPGERLLQHGKAVTRVAGARKIERWDCVRLETEFESAIEESRSRQLFRGRAVGYFSPAEGRFIRASAVVTTSSRKIERTKDGKAWVLTFLDARSESRVRSLSD
jgi:hypothetical protein